MTGLCPTPVRTRHPSFPPDVSCCKPPFPTGRSPADGRLRPALMVCTALIPAGKIVYFETQVKFADDNRNVSAVTSTAAGDESVILNVRAPSVTEAPMERAKTHGMIRRNNLKNMAFAGIRLSIEAQLPGTSPVDFVVGPNIAHGRGRASEKSQDTGLFVSRDTICSECYELRCRRNSAKSSGELTSSNWESVKQPSGGVSLRTRNCGSSARRTIRLSPASRYFTTNGRQLQP